MSKGQIKTDNSFLQDKIELRLNHLPDKEKIYILDCYAGDGIIWNKIKNHSNKQIKILGIDRENKKGVYLKGDNRKFLKTMDLKKFDVIDMDSYGVPYEQLRIIFDRGFKGVVFVTFIQSVMGQLPRRMLYEVGYTKRMIDNIPSLFNRNGIEKFKRYLYLHGIDRVFMRNSGRKYYLSFKIL